MDGNLVVAIAIVTGPSGVLIARRRDDAPLGGFWEFPGGKVEAGESPDQTALRELREECGVEASIQSAFKKIVHAYPDRTVEIHPYLCHYEAGQAQPLGCAEVAWVRASDLGQYRFPPANDGLLKELEAYLRSNERT